MENAEPVAQIPVGLPSLERGRHNKKTSFDVFLGRREGKKEGSDCGCCCCYSDDLLWAEKNLSDFLFFTQPCKKTSGFSFLKRQKKKKRKKVFLKIPNRKDAQSNQKRVQRRERPGKKYLSQEKELSALSRFVFSSWTSWINAHLSWDAFFKHPSELSMNLWIEWCLKNAPPPSGIFRVWEELQWKIAFVLCRKLVRCFLSIESTNSRLDLLKIYWKIQLLLLFLLLGREH